MVAPVDQMYSKPAGPESTTAPPPHKSPPVTAMVGLAGAEITATVTVSEFTLKQVAEFPVLTK